ncbi:MAG: cupin domain-containing protein [Actinomycetota bacterium]
MSELRVIRPSARLPDEASGAMVREAAISEQTVGARRLWFGFVRLETGLVSGAHHHGEAESGIYIISGRARFYTGDGLDDVQDASAGDFVWVPPQVVHVEQNAGDEPVVMAVARSTQETLVFQRADAGGLDGDELTTGSRRGPRPRRPTAPAGAERKTGAAPRPGPRDWR